MSSSNTPPPPLRDQWRDRPLESRLSPASPVYAEIMERHRAAVERGFPSYADPVSGFSVFTAVFLAGRNYCCESGCRHCPYAV